MSVSQIRDVHFRSFSFTMFHLNDTIYDTTHDTGNIRDDTTA